MKTELWRKRFVANWRFPVFAAALFAGCIGGGAQSIFVGFFCFVFMVALIALTTVSLHLEVQLALQEAEDDREEREPLLWEGD